MPARAAPSMSPSSSSTRPPTVAVSTRPMTRGREANHAYVVTEDNRMAADALTQALGRDWIDQPAHARRLQLGPHRARQVTSEPTRQLEPDGPGDENEEQTRGL